MTETERIAIVSEQDLLRMEQEEKRLEGRIEHLEDEVSRFWLKTTLISAVVCVVCAKVFGDIGAYLGGLLL